MCKEFGQRPSEIMGFEGTLIERLYFDNLVLATKSELGSRSAPIEKVNELIKGWTPRTWNKKKGYLGSSE